ncbi:MAG: topoisomerase [Gaiellales bacterium]|nr:topoisomerase [Gaiellales bacterium]MDX6596955.1 topoisomerase [Gaiellales bacterium]
MTHVPVTLVIAEKKSVAVDVSKALEGTFKANKNFLEGPDTVITWAVGHLAELAAPEHYDDKFKRWKMGDLPILPNHFDVVPRAEGKSAKEQLDAIAKLMKRDDIDLIVNACDAGREGELIFAYVLDVAGKKGLPVQRAWFSSMTKDAIRQAFGHLRPGSELAPLEAAARSRSEADWLVGMNATRAATIRGRAAFGSTVVSLGRVQTPTLAILVRREKEIQAFEPTPYWLVDATFQPTEKTAYRGRHVRGTETHILTGEDADAIVERVRDGEGHITSLSKRTQRSQPPLLYDLTALQREAASWHGFTARRTLSAAQGCYEKAVLTYPRTSSRYLSSDMIPELKEIAGHVGKRSKEYAKGAAYVQSLPELPLGRIVNNEKVTDHHAIIPTNAPQAGIELSPDEQRIYDMAARRFLAAFHSQAVFENTTVLTEVAGESFRSRGKVMLEAGWRAVYGEAPPDEQKAQGAEIDEDEGTDQELPALEEGEKVRCTDVASDARETKPPPRYGEAALLAAMEGAGKLVEDDELREAMKDSGIGTPATRASIIERLIDVGYIVRDGRRLQPTGKGIQVIDLLGEHELTSPSLTGDWEHRLLDIERAGGSREAFMRDIAQFTEKTVAYLRDLPPEALRFQRRDLDITCPRCGEGHLIENAKGFGCSTWKSAEEPGCGFVIWKSIGGKQLTEDIVRTLIEEGKTKELTGFRSNRTGRPYRAMLVLDPKGERTVSFEFKPRPQKGAPKEEAPVEQAG